MSKARAPAAASGGAAATRAPAQPLLLARRDLLPAELPAPGSADAATASLLAALLGYRPWALGLGVPTAVLDVWTPDGSVSGGPPADGCHVWDPIAPGPFDAAARVEAAPSSAAAAASAGGGKQCRSTQTSSSAPAPIWYKVAWAGYSRQLHATWVPGTSALAFAHPGALHAVLVEAVVSKGARLWHPAAAGGVRALSAGGLVALDDDVDGADSDAGGGSSAAAGAKAGAKRKRGAAAGADGGAPSRSPAASAPSSHTPRAPCLPFSVADRGEEVLEEVDDDQAAEMEAWGLTPASLAAATVDALRYRPVLQPPVAAAAGGARGKPAAAAATAAPVSAKALQAALAGCPWWTPREQQSSAGAGAGAATKRPAKPAAANSDDDGTDDDAADLRVSDDEDEGRDPWDRSAPSAATLREAAVQWGR